MRRSDARTEPEEGQGTFRNLAPRKEDTEKLEGTSLGNVKSDTVITKCLRRKGKLTKSNTEQSPVTNKAKNTVARGNETPLSSP